MRITNITLLSLLLLIATNVYSGNYIHEDLVSNIIDHDISIKDSNEMLLLPKDNYIGNRDAPIKMILYTSYVCFHCVNFIKDTLPILKEKYIDTGRLLIAFRTFALDAEDFKAAKIAQCYVEKKYCKATDCAVTGCCDNRSYLRMMNILFNSSLSSGSTKTLDIINNIAQVNFMNSSEIDECMNDKELELKILSIKLMAIKSFKMQGTPYMIIDGTRYQGIKDLEFFEKLFDEKTENNSQK